MVALGDWLGYYRMGNRVDILPNMGSGNWSVYIQRLMATIAMGLGQFQRFLSCDLDTGLHTCGLGSRLHSWCHCSSLSFLPLPLENLVKWSESHSVVSDSLWPHGLHSWWNSPGQNTGVGSLSLLQGIFPIQRSNPERNIKLLYFQNTV